MSKRIFITGESQYRRPETVKGIPIKEYMRQYRENHKEHLRILGKNGMRRWRSSPKNRKHARKLEIIRRVNNPEKYKTRDREKKRRTRLSILKHYSPNLICQKCGFNDIRSLTLDHIMGEGTKHRNRIGSGDHFYRWIIKQGFPSGYKVLCSNCQKIKSIENHETRKSMGLTPKNIREENMKRYYRTKNIVMSKYSPEMKCRKCGSSNPNVLSLDHLYGRGKEHSRLENINNLYYWVKKNEFPSGFQVLCMNCQAIKRWENNENFLNHKSKYGGTQ